MHQPGKLQLSKKQRVALWSSSSRISTRSCGIGTLASSQERLRRMFSSSASTSASRTIEACLVLLCNRPSLRSTSPHPMHRLALGLRLLRAPTTATTGRKSLSGSPPLQDLPSRRMRACPSNDAVCGLSHSGASCIDQRRDLCLHRWVWTVLCNCREPILHRLVGLAETRFHHWQVPAQAEVVEGWTTFTQTCTLG